MLFTKTFTNCIKQSKKDYERIMNRRRERLLFFIQHDMPRFIIVNEIELLRESFFKFFIRRYFC